MRLPLTSSLGRRGFAAFVSGAVVSVLTAVLGTATPAFASAGGPATKLVITVPGAMTSGVPITVTFYAEDAGGNVDTSFHGMVTVSGTGGRSYYPGYGQVTLSAGTGTLDLALFAAGPQTLTPADMSGAGLVGVAIPETVNPGPTASITVSAPTQVGVNQDFSIGVTQFDAAGNVVVNGDNLTIATGAASTFPTTFNTSGRPTGQISVQGPTDIAVDDLANAGLDHDVLLTVGPAITATHLQLSFDQSTSTAGANRQLTVEAVDGGGNLQTTSGLITLTSTDARAVLNSGNPVGLVNGTATVPVMFETAADQTITAVDGGSLSGTSATVSVAAGWISTLQVDAPATLTPGTQFTGTISGLDFYGNQSLASTGVVTLTWSSNADPADPTSATYVNGIATFAGSFITAGPGTVTAGGPNFWDPSGTTSITVDAPAVVAAPTVPVGAVRLSGADPFATAVAIAAQEFPDGGASAVVLARSDDAADSTVGTVLAAAKNAPLLLTTGATLPAATATEIARVIPAGGTVYVLGGTSAIPSAVATQLTGHGYAVVRLAGSDRYATAIAIANAIGGPGPVFLATGTDFADALTAGPAAAHNNGVVLLTDGAVMPAAVRAYLAAHHGAVFAVGGHAAAADSAATAMTGSDRYSTAAMVATRFFNSPTSVGVASGTTFADGLSGSAYLAHLGGPLLLTTADFLPDSASAYLASTKSPNALTFGGATAINNDTMTAIDAALGR